MPATSASKPVAKIRITQTAYDLAMKLFAIDANKKAVPVTKDMLGPHLGELTSKQNKVAVRQGHSSGPYGRPGTVKLLVSKDALEPKPVRHRKSTKPIARAKATNRTEDVRKKLSIDALEEFIQTYRDTEGPILLERRRTVQSTIDQIQAHLAVAKNDDFRNTMAMANRELKKLDEIDKEVTTEVLHGINPGVSSPLFPVWAAMAHKGD
jgi:hypothetical protein